MPTAPEIHRLSRRRALLAHALRADGHSLAKVGRLMGGLSPSRARELVNKGQRILERDYAHVGEAIGIAAGRLRQGWGI